MRLRGVLTQDDAVKMEMIKKQYFLDYVNVEKYLHQQRQLSRGIPVREELVKTVSLVNKNEELDDRLSPLSLTSVRNQTAMIFTRRPKFTE